ncbi:transcriptional regulator, ArsR family [Cyclonatronum proteinivorum]|uniref:Transcriptional regulator, ArsR family n=1 Tax=Cyclonatronum proteinivorum TaxID=1457365 RepID=A0A345UGM7_9BACT|nr:metalloregulator ArsR/SmtB family transcription factor [Cyclonatronum proteinivorum]AXI99628.1 transcriptional regulator, ArsR family [Cyclonatronum proteinivorum]
MAKLNDQTLEHVAQRFKILGEPMRLRLLACLQQGERCVQDLVSETGAGQANVSKHLSLMISHGILGRRKEGLHVYYFIADDSVYDLCDLVCESIAEKAEGVQRLFSQAGG